MPSNNKPRKERNENPDLKCLVVEHVIMEYRFTETQIALVIGAHKIRTNKTNLPFFLTLCTKDASPNASYNKLVFEQAITKLPMYQLYPNVYH
jgi:hypothetical protein